MDHQRFSFLGATVTGLGQVIVLPPTWSPEVRAAVAFVLSLLVGVAAPAVKAWGNRWVDARVGRREAERRAAEAEAERDELRKENARLRAGLPLLAPPVPPAP